jgi:hypothetical protein
VSARDSGKTPLEAVLGEVIVTAEKLTWLISEGEAVLKPSRRGAGVMVRFTVNPWCMVLQQNDVIVLLLVVACAAVWGCMLVALYCTPQHCNVLYGP